jgi:hypothetical protein
VLAQRPDVFTAEREVAAASAEVDNAHAERYPRLTLNGSIGTGYVRTGWRRHAPQHLVHRPGVAEPCRSSTAAAAPPTRLRPRRVTKRPRRCTAAACAPGRARGRGSAGQPGQRRRPQRRREHRGRRATASRSPPPRRATRRPGQPGGTRRRAPQLLAVADRAAVAATRALAGLGGAVPRRGRRLVGPTEVAAPLASPPHRHLRR